MNWRLPAKMMLVGLLIVPTAALAQSDALNLAIRGSTFDEDGSVELVVNVTGSAKPEVVDSDAFAVTENGTDVGEVEAEPIRAGEDLNIVTTLLIDVSGSMDGEPMELTRTAAESLVRTLTDENLEVGLMTFGTRVEELAAPTSNADELVALIEGIESGGYTALYDGIVAAAAQLADAEGQRNLVVFSDGGDTRSEASLEDAVLAAGQVEVPVVAIALETDDLDPDALNELAVRTDGRVRMAADADALAAEFDEVASEIASQYVVRYASPDPDSEAGELDIEVSLAVAEAEATTSFTVLNPRQADEPAPQVATRVPDGPGLLTGSTGLVVGTGAAFLAILLLLGLMFNAQPTRGDRVLAGQLERYIDRGERRAGRSGLVATHFRERAMQMVESAPKPKGFDERLTMRLEQAAWPLRNGEFLLMSLGAALLVGTVVGVLSHWLGGVLMGGVAGAIPSVILSVRRSRRQDAFLRNLPDTLQLMAGSLRAGYGVLQALDTVAKESTGPASEEFQRVITEARLGMPVEDALEAMAERIDSDDFRWVVLAINIQREVGGNLAELLDTVAETLREREMLRRQIKVLSAEGRLSAGVLIALPIVLTIYLILVRPEYIGTLVTSGLFGWAMVIGASVLMLGGVFWIRKMIQIEV